MDSYDDGRTWSPERLAAEKVETDRLWAEYLARQVAPDAQDGG